MRSVSCQTFSSESTCPYGDLMSLALRTIQNIDSSILPNATLEATLGVIIDHIIIAFGATKGGIMLYDEHNNALALQKPSFKADEKDIREYIVSLKEASNAANVFLTNTPLISNNCKNDKRIINKFVILFQMENVMTVPIKNRSKTIGVFHIGNKKSGEWSELDLRLFELMAAYIGNIIERAGLVERLINSNNELFRSQQKIISQQLDLEKILSVHNKVLFSLVRNGSLKQLLQILSEEIQYSVFLFDNLCNCLEHVIIDVEHIQLEKIFPIKKKIEAKQFVLINNKKMYATSFKIKSEYFDTDNIFLVILSANKLSDLEKNIVQQTSVFIALEMLNQHRLQDIQNKLGADFLEDLLFSKNIVHKNLLSRAAFMGFNFIPPHVIILFDIDGFSNYLQNEKLNEQDILSLKHVLFKTAQKEISAHFPPKNFLLTEKSDKILVLLYFQATYITDMLKDIIINIQHNISLQLSPLTVSVGVSNLCHELDEYKDNYFATKGIMNKNSSLNMKNFIVFQNELGINDMFYDLFAFKKYRLYTNAFLSPLLDYQSKHKTPLIETSEKYLATLSLQETAQSLYTHVNTVKYRLNKIEDLLNIKFCNQEDRIKLTFLLNIYKFNNAKAGLDEDIHNYRHQPKTFFAEPL